MKDALERARRRIRTDGVMPYVYGLWVRRHFQRAGLIVVLGWPFPDVDNRGTIEVGNCAFFPGVRLECWPGASIRIGTGTYLNRNCEIVAGREVAIGRDCKIARDVLIMDTDQHALPGGSDNAMVAPVRIGDEAWIGARA